MTAIKEARESKGWSPDDLDEKCQLHRASGFGLPLHSCHDLEADPTLLNSRLFSILCHPLNLTADRILRDKLLVRQLRDLSDTAWEAVFTEDFLKTTAKFLGATRNGEHVTVQFLLHLNPDSTSLMECRIVFKLLREIDQVYQHRHDKFNAAGFHKDWEKGGADVVEELIESFQRKSGSPAKT